VSHLRTTKKRRDHTVSDERAAWADPPCDPTLCSTAPAPLHCLDRCIFGASCPPEPYEPMSYSLYEQEEASMLVESAIPVAADTVVVNVSFFNRNLFAPF
jgi:hypothetical protein